MKTMQENMNHGDFTQLAKEYAQHRPGYAPIILKMVLKLVDKRPADIDFVDVGAGTGIWTRMVAECGCRMKAVEPNDKMREYGFNGNAQLPIEWTKGTAEQTGLNDHSFDFVSMASSFHWADFDKATKEFARLLRPGGCFVALWNPRLIEVNSLLVAIEAKLQEMIPDLKRVSSGRSEFCNTLMDRLTKCDYFKDVVYMEARHSERMTPERYIGVWRSVNDIQVQAGPERFEKFMQYVKNLVEPFEYIDATYLTRAWVSKVKK